MEQNRLHDAADTLTMLLKAHVSDVPEEVDVHDAIAVRDDIRELAYEKEESDESDGYDLPEPGDVVFDKDHNAKFGNGDVKVLEVLPNAKAETHYVYDKTGKKSVAYHNPKRDPEAPIVKGEYVDGSGKIYAFPADRLR